MIFQYNPTSTPISASITYKFRNYLSTLHINESAQHINVLQQNLFRTRQFTLLGCNSLMVLSAQSLYLILVIGVSFHFRAISQNMLWSLTDFRRSSHCGSILCYSLVFMAGAECSYFQGHSFALKHVKELDCAYGFSLMSSKLDFI